MTAAPKLAPIVLDAAAEINTLGISWQTVAQLAEPTPADQIRRREGPGGRTLDYVDARYVMKRLDDVCGPYWQRAHAMNGEKVAAGIGILVDGTWIWRWDGAGETDIEGEKGSFSDSFKRAGVNWGIARDLYPDASSSAQAGRPSSRPAAAPTQPVYEGMGDDDPRNDDGPPPCPVHRVPMVVSKFPDKKTGRIGWYCREKAREGEPANSRGYCNQQVAG